MTNRYDGDGVKLFTEDSHDAVYYLMDRGQILGELDPAGAVIASTWRGVDGSPLFTVQRLGVYYYHTDRLGSVQVLTKPDGTYDDRYTYDEFGMVKVAKGEAWNSFQYTGAPYSEQAGLLHLGARHYNPAIGRFLTQDTYKGSPWQPWTQNLYTYVGNNPVRYTDPTGHKNIDSAGGGGGADAIFALYFWLSTNGTDVVQTVVDSAQCAEDPSIEGCAQLIPDAVALVVPGPQTIGGTGTTDLETRAKEIHSTLPEYTQTKTTTAVARVQNPDGSVEIQVASSEPRLRPAQRAALNPGEVEVTGSGHAEQTIINSAQEKGQTVTEIAASRPICSACAQAIGSAGARAVSPYKGFVGPIEY